jgi:hypothetical protein
MACSLLAHKAPGDYRLDISAQTRRDNQQAKQGTGMIREFRYKGETFRVNAHGAPGHEEVFIIHLVGDEEMGEISIDRMTEENDRSAPIDAICVMLCDKLIVEQEITCADPAGAFVWVEGKRIRDVLPSNEAAAH